jgi:hypothetical protein
MLRLTRQVGPCVITDLAPRLVSVRGGLDQPDIVAAIRGARGEWDKGLRHFVVETRFLRRLEDELRTVVDPLFRGRQGAAHCRQ